MLLSSGLVVTLLPQMGRVHSEQQGVRRSPCFPSLAHAAGRSKHAQAHQAGRTAEPGCSPLAGCDSASCFGVAKGISGSWVGPLSDFSGGSTRRVARGLGNHSALPSLSREAPQPLSPGPQHAPSEPCS